MDAKDGCELGGPETAVDGALPFLCSVDPIEVKLVFAVIWLAPKVEKLVMALFVETPVVEFSRTE